LLGFGSLFSVVLILLIIFGWLVLGFLYIQGVTIVDVHRITGLSPRTTIKVQASFIYFLSKYWKQNRRKCHLIAAIKQYSRHFDMTKLLQFLEWNELEMGLKEGLIVMRLLFVLCTQYVQEYSLP